MAVAPAGGTATTNAIAQGGGAGQAFANPGQTAYAFSTALPDKAYAATLIDGASNVAEALLGRRDVVFGTAILGGNYAPDGGGESDTYSASSTFDFAYRGDLLLGLIGSQETGFADGLGFELMEFTIVANGVEILDSTFKSLSVAESFFRDSIIDLGSDMGPNIDLTFGYSLVADGSGGFGFDFAVGGAVPESINLGDDAGRLRQLRFRWLFSCAPAEDVLSLLCRRRQVEPRAPAFSHVGERSCPTASRSDSQFSQQSLC